MVSRPVAARASRSALMTASVPLDTKRTISTLATEAVILSPSSTSSGARARDPRERLERPAPQVDPAARRGGVQRGVLATYLVRREGHIEAAAGRRDHVEVRPGRLHHDHVRALVDVGGDLPQGLAPVGRIHLVPGAVPQPRRAIARGAERAADGGPELPPRS